MFTRRLIVLSLLLAACAAGSAADEPWAHQWIDPDLELVRKKIASRSGAALRRALGGRKLVAPPMGQIRNPGFVPLISEGDNGCTSGAIARAVGYLKWVNARHEWHDPQRFSDRYLRFIGGQVTHAKAREDLRSPTAYGGSALGMTPLGQKLLQFLELWEYQAREQHKLALRWPRHIRYGISFVEDYKVAGKDDWVPSFSAWANRLNDDQMLVFRIRTGEGQSAAKAGLHLTLLYKVLRFEAKGQRPVYGLMFLDDRQQGDRTPHNYMRGPILLGERGRCLNVPGFKLMDIMLLRWQGNKIVLPGAK